MTGYGKRLLYVCLTALVIGNAGLFSACGREPDPHTLTVGDAGIGTIGEALARIREERAGGDRAPFKVLLPAGVYECGEPLVFDAALSDVTIEALGDGEAALAGGYRVTGFVRDTFNGADCLSAPVRDTGFTDFYVNDRRASMTRYPADGFLYMEDCQNHDPGRDEGSSWFIAEEGALDGIPSFDGVQLSFCHDWIDEHTPVTHYDPVSRKVSLKYRSRFYLATKADGGEGTPYWLDNVAGAFGRPDDWFVSEGRVYYIPRDESVTPETIEAYVPLTDTLIRIGGTEEEPVRGVTVRGLKLGITKGDYVCRKGNTAYASNAQSVNGAGGFVSLGFAQDCVIEDCRLIAYGLHGIDIGEGCSGIRVSRCEFREGGGGGVRIGGAYDENSPGTTGHNIVEDCTIDSCGRRYYASCGILMMHTPHNIIRHNEISNLYYSGISCGWVWGYYENASHDNLITKNHIHDIGGPLSDLGGIYTLGPQPGTVISNNIIHDITCGVYGGWALSLDEGTSFITVENNICYNLESNVLTLHYGRENLIRNNIFALSGGENLTVSRTEAFRMATFERNIVYTDGQPAYILRHPHISKGRVVMNGNLYWDRTGETDMLVRLADYNGKGFSLDTVRDCYHIEEGSLIADPQFTDPGNFDFTLKETSPAFALGFEAIDTSDVGPRR